MNDAGGDETDSKDDCICPIDYESAGMILDDDMNAILCMPLPQGSFLTSIFDCCHSGS
jgi:hypothetical protein